MESLKYSNVITRWTDRLCVVHSHGWDTSDLGVFYYRCKMVQGEVSILYNVSITMLHELGFLNELERVKEFFFLLCLIFFFLDLINIY